MAATFDEVKDALNHPEVYLIDVRRKDEIASTGSIPASLNIPCKFAFRLFPLFLCLICSSINSLSKRYSKIHCFYLSLD